MRCSPLFATLFVLLCCRSALAVDRIYTLIQPPEFESSVFGFEGTIITDGSIGTFSNADFIKDWSITLFTPSSADGVSMQTSTSATGSIITESDGQSLFSVTETDIAILGSGLNGGAGGLQIGDLLEEWIWYIGPSGGVGSVQMLDVSESPFRFDVNSGSLSALPVATGGFAVPEPSAALLGGLACVGLLTVGRRRWC